MVVQVGLAFIRQEREVDYNWSLEIFRDIMLGSQFRSLYRLSGIERLP
jgi:hypothetical protein